MMKKLLKITISTILIFLTSFTYANICKDGISIEKVLEIVKNNHPVIRIALLSNKIASSEVLSSQGEFDLKLKAYGFYKRYNSSSELGEPQHSDMYNSELELLTRYGILIRAGADLNNGDIKTPVSPTGDDGEYFVGINAPLFRGAKLNTFSVNESLAKFNSEKVQNNFRLIGLELLLKTITTYWKWAASQQKLEIEKKLLDLSLFRLESISKRQKNGDLAAIDVVEIKQEVQRRKSRVLMAERNYQKLSYELSWFLWQQNYTETINVLGCKAKDFNAKSINYSKVSFKDGKIIALENRPELRELEISKMIADLEKDFATNDLLPRLDLAVKVGKQTGKGSMSGQDVKAGLEFDIPLQRRDAKGRLAKFNFELSKIDLEQKNTIQKIFLQVDDAISALKLSRKNIKTVKEEVNFANQMQDGESKKFTLGDSNLFIVNTRERVAAEAKIKLIDTLFKYYLAKGYYLAVTGQLI